MQEEGEIVPSFLILHSVCQDDRLDAYRQPPTLDIGGLRAPLDWGDTTLHVPAGDLPVTIFVTRANGQVEGATITVRAPAGTGTRLTFVPPLDAGSSSLLRIDGQWPADSSMHYYAARDARWLAPPTSPQPSASSASSPQGSQPAGSPSATSPSASPLSAGQGSASPATMSAPATAPEPAVGPLPGSTGSVPPQASSFGIEQGARVDPVQPSAEASAPPQPGHPTPNGTHPSPSFGQRLRTERDVYGREHVADDRQPPPIPTPAEFSRLEQEAAAAQRRVYEAWQAQQQAGVAPAGSTPHDGAPQPIGLAANTGQAEPAWYPDPFRRADSRWFDGRQWTASVMRGGVRGHDQPG